MRLMEDLEPLHRIPVSCNPEGHNVQLRRQRLLKEGKDVMKRPNWAVLRVLQVRSSSMVTDEDVTIRCIDLCSLERSRSRIVK